MLHDNAEIKKINDRIGFGVFARALIPKGTIVYIKDKLELVIKHDSALLKDPLYRPHIEKYSYVEANGSHVVSWDLAKYVNHCCFSNCLTTGYGFEIAVRDILPGEEITDDYGIFYKVEEMTLECSKPGCRKILRTEDFPKYQERWDNQIREALAVFQKVEQPLLPYLPAKECKSLSAYLESGEGYKSVSMQEPESILKRPEMVNGQIGISELRV